MYVFTLVESMVTAAKQILLNNGCDLNDIRYSKSYTTFIIIVFIFNVLLFY